MSLLLLQSCSSSKEQVEGTLPALELYTGYFYKIIKKAMRHDERRSGLDLRILSAEHGLLHPEEEVEYYDRRMDRERAEKLRDEVVSDLRELIRKEQYSRVIINMGEEYKNAIQSFDRDLDVVVTVIEGDGIGYKGHILKRVIRGDDSALEVAN
ncbi:DUF6884 domain-containing protein [Halosimplex amylolyticum]|uniref:DUF6884 domain-containing protein n=1 Tax=Halosimplex amylolyticum TaxID=3396616 RepID=UPI003F57479A